MKTLAAFADKGTGSDFIENKTPPYQSSALWYGGILYSDYI